MAKEKTEKPQENPAEEPQSVEDRTAGLVEAEPEDLAAPADEPRPAPPPDSWADRWWVWALGGLALAGFIGILHLLSHGTGGS